MSKETVLVVSSSADTLELQGGKRAEIGVYLNELVVPAMALVAGGYEIVLATPTGKKPIIDAVSRDASHFNNDAAAFQKALDFFDSYPAMVNPVTLRTTVEQGLDGYAAVFVPGGHAPIVDLAQDEDMGTVLRHFHDTGKPTALLCHGPIALIAAVPQMKAFRAALDRDDLAGAKAVGGGWPYAGYQMTIFSNDEDKVAEEQLLHGRMKFYVGDALQAAGGIVTSNTKVFDPHLTEDRELITGQNPRSDHLVANALLAALER
ncbi:type 1 glutamine amidotransferase domain-containing protein [Caballeronia sp. LZ065]|uniref:type 1 glutamine amidotransferase domain-containing protein n=1 Tax=Caballeronia sp. LZ065 TaxID=3038571 RepID=UPI002865C5A7|nr:type 1 glutamine amidotransferase domain-containing protein [Caballeronia sp. LZ065]MDR5782582.1 type 1 glutamine amidotransferase domain-containing protein [Caballeronia sp. LZ065]